MKALAYSVFIFLSAIHFASADEESQTKGRLQLAIAYKQNAIRQLEKLSQKAGSREERLDVLARILETVSEMSRLSAELDEVEGVDTSTSPRYRNALEGVVKEGNRILQQNPSAHMAIRTRYLRGEAYRNLGNKRQAIEDLKWAALQEEKNADSTAAALVAYDLLISQGDYRAAISCLKNVDAKKGDVHYPLVLEYLAWSYYYQADYQRAMGTLAELLEYQRGRAEKVSRGEREQSYKGAGMFLASAIEEKKPGFNIEGGVKFLTENVDRKYFPAAIKYFALGLSTKNLYPEIHELLAKLKSWQNFSSEETLAIHLIALDQVLNIRHSEEVERGVRDILASAIFENQEFRNLPSETQQNLKKQLGRSANILLQSKTKSSGELFKLLQILKDFPGLNDEEIALHRHNLAEVSFRLKRYDEATEEYRWLAKNLKGEMATDSWLKSIGARFESLKANGLVPEELSLQETKDRPKRELAGQTKEWIGWILAYGKRPGSRSEKVDPFRFEAGRILFDSGNYSAANGLFIQLAKESKDKKLVFLSAGAVLDGLIIEEKWNELLQQALEYAQRKDLEKTPFARKASSIVSDATLQLAGQEYREKDYNRVIERVEALRKSGIASGKWGELNVLAAHAALALEDRPLAKIYLSRVLESDLKPKLKAKAFLGAAVLSEEQFEYGEAADNYLSSFSLEAPTGEEGKALRERALRLTWISGDHRKLGRALSKSVLCANANKEQCDRYRVLAAASAPRPSAVNEALEKAQGKSSSKGIWSLIALQKKKLSQGKRNILMRSVSEEWSSFDSITQFALLPLIPRLLQSMEAGREGLGLTRKIEISKAALSLKAKAILGFEEQMTRFIEFPITRVRVQALYETSKAYRDLARQFQRVPGLTEVTAPFLDKQHELEKKAFVLASRASVNEDIFKKVSKAYFVSFPEDAASLNKDLPATRPVDLDALLLKVLAKAKDPRILAWRNALSQRRWAAVGALIEDSNGGEIEARIFQRMKAASLAAIGETAEAMAELEVLRRNGGEKDPDVCMGLLSHYLSTLAKKETASALPGCSGVAAVASLLAGARLWAVEGRSPGSQEGGEQ